MFTHCGHIMPSGRRCQSPAMRGSAFCYFHGRRIPPAGKRPSTEHRVQMPATLDRGGITQALQSVLAGLAEDRISARRAGILLMGLQMAARHPADSDPDPDPDLLPDELFSSALDSEEATAASNALAQKVGLVSDGALTLGPQPKSQPGNTTRLPHS
jgi:hypothetical protein